MKVPFKTELLLINLKDYPILEVGSEKSFMDILVYPRGIENCVAGGQFLLGECFQVNRMFLCPRFCAITAICKVLVFVFRSLSTKSK
ncbi:hypothetical protein LOK49_LG14G01943 [Camellia lanceoleosa]|uniref:Uncharacterized protein n=1 Tax=Camellia lanceoleosa TaxID=1840588 RepID=A0ACC0FCL6_9ERIC|nr:hypothetical protein LOK49_LG14G01943 [Camellia lanceoleosa]